MKFYIEAFPSYRKEIEANNLAEVLSWISARQIAKLEYSIFSGYPYTFENKVYHHLAQ